MKIFRIFVFFFWIIIDSFLFCSFLHPLDTLKIDYDPGNKEKMDAFKEMEGFVPYVIKEGDTLFKIALPQYWEIILKVNRIDEKHLIPGNVILIPKNFEKISSFCPVPKEISSNQERVVVFYLKRQYFGAYERGELLFWGPISSGKKGYETPTGTFRARWKSKNYFSKKYKAPMPYAVNFSSEGLFFHEQALPGKPSSHGCIRLLKIDAKKLFYWIKKGDKIIIKSD